MKVQCFWMPLDRLSYFSVRCTFSHPIWDFSNPETVIFWDASGQPLNSIYTNYVLVLFLYLYNCTTYSGVHAYSTPEYIKYKESTPTPYIHTPEY
jgi:hypothetical protein